MTDKLKRSFPKELVTQGCPDEISVISGLCDSSNWGVEVTTTISSHEEGDSSIIWENRAYIKMLRQDYPVDSINEIIM